MPRTLKVLLLVTAALALSTLPAAAQCTSASQVFGHQIGGAILNCFDAAEVSGYAYVAGIAPPAPTPNSGTSNIICEANGEITQGAPSGCFDGNPSGTGDKGDGFISISGNWANAGITGGCPNPNGSNFVGRNVIVIRDNKGGSVVISLGYSADYAGYPAEFAEAAGGEYVVSCANAGRTEPTSKCLQVNDVQVVDNGNQTLTGTVTAIPLSPQLFSDCDSRSIGAQVGTCGPAESITAAPGSIYTNVGPCDGSTLNLSRAAWTPGNSRTYASNLCMFVGASNIINGVESNGINCAVAVSNQLPAKPKALGLKARKDGGNVVLEFFTDTEAGLINFEVQTKSGRSVGTITAKGQGGAARYTETLKRGDFRNETELYVIAVTSSSREKSDLASF